MPYQPPIAYSLRARRARLDAVRALIDIGPEPGFFLLFDAREENFRLRVNMLRPCGQVVESALVFFCPPLVSDEPIVAGSVTNLDIYGGDHELVVSNMPWISDDTAVRPGVVFHVTHFEIFSPQ